VGSVADLEGISIKWQYKKHEYWLEAMEFLEHMVPKDEIEVNLQKVKAVTKCRRSTNALRLETV